MAETEYADSGLHQASTWDQRNMTQTGTYNTGAPYTDAWIPSNAAANNNDVVSQNGIITDKLVFSGGYAGNCPTGQAWTYVRDESKWACSGSLQWNFDYYVPDVQSSSYTGTTGIFLNKSVFYDDQQGILQGNAPQQSFANAWVSSPQHSGRATIDAIRYTCYPGQQKSGNQINWNAQDVKQGSIPASTNTAQTGRVLLPYDISLSGQSQYSCNFQFHVNIKNGGSDWKGNLGTAQEISNDQTARQKLNIEPYVSSLGVFQPSSQPASNLLSIS